MENKKRCKQELTVCVATLNRPKIVKNLLLSLAPFSQRIKKVLICDQSSNDLIFDEIKACDLGDLKVVVYRVNFKSLTKARNFLVSKSLTEFVCFLDDDAEIFQSYFDGIEEELISGTKIITGPVLNPGVQLKSIDSYSVFEKENSEKLHHTLSNADFNHYASWFPGGNFTVAKDLLIKSGGFEELFYGSAVGEDAEMSKRLRILFKAKISYNKKCGIYHFPMENGGCHEEKKFKYILSYMSNVHFMFMITAGDLVYKNITRLGILKSLVLKRKMSLWLRVVNLFAYMCGLINGTQMALKKWLLDVKYLPKSEEDLSAMILEEKLIYKRGNI